MNKKPKIKILMAYHKKAPLLKNDVLVPIHVGRDVATIPSRNGNVTDKDLKWLKKNMIGDNTGDNISHLNRSFNEMTAVYWAWKNYDKLGNPDYIGLMHYRRHLNLLNKWDIVYNSTKYLNEIGLDQKTLEKLCEQYDLITTLGAYAAIECYNFEKRYTVESGIIRKQYPNLFKEKEKFKDDRMIHFGNLFIMKKEYFFQYCKIIFDVLFSTKKNYEKVHTYDINILGHYGYASEYLSTFYFRWLKESKHLKTLEVPLRVEEFSFLKNFKMQLEVKKAKIINLLNTCKTKWQKTLLIFNLSIIRI